MRRQALHCQPFAVMVLSRRQLGQKKRLRETEIGLTGYMVEGSEGGHTFKISYNL